MENKNRFWSVMMVLTATILWGFSFVWSKQLLNVMGSISIIFFRMIIASISLYTFGKVTGMFQSVKRCDIKHFFLISLVQPFLYFIFELSSIKYNSPTLTALIIAQIPLFIGLTNYIFNKKRLSFKIITSIIVSLIGVSLVILGGNNTSITSSTLGIILALCAMVCAVIYNFRIQRIVKYYNPLTITTYIHAISFIYLLPLFFVFEWESIQEVTFTLPIIGAILSLGILCSAIAFLFYIYGVKNIGIVTSSMINNLSPAVTAIGVFLILGEELSPIRIFGVIITIVGLAIISEKRGKTRSSAKRKHNTTK